MSQSCSSDSSLPVDGSQARIRCLPRSNASDGSDSSDWTLVPDESSSPRHRYAPLAPTQIRLLSLFPGYGSAPVVATLHHAILLSRGAILLDDLGKQIDYEALSYSWGEDGSTGDIELDGVMVPVRWSLRAALRSLRPKSGESVRWMWVDALCINQADNEEKSREIQKMFRIYFAARRCLVWLGVEPDCGLEWRALMFLRDVDLKTESENRSDFAAELRAACEGMKLLAKRPWWERIWVRQEVFAAREVVFSADDVSLSSKLLKSNIAKAAAIWNRFGGRRIGNVPEIDVSGLRALVINIAQVQPGKLQDTALLASGMDWNQLETSQHISLDRILRKSMRFKATDPKDFIYGVVSMTTTKTFTKTPDIANNSASSASTDVDSDTAQLPISYGSSLPQVFADATEYIMKFHQSLDCIFLVGYTGRSISGLPSWVPTWPELPQYMLIDKIWTVIDTLDRESATEHSIETGWNKLGRLDQRDKVETNVILGSRHCSRFSSLRPLLHKTAEFRVVSDEGGTKLICTGTLLGHVTDFRTSSQKSIDKEYWDVASYTRGYINKFIDQHETHKLVSIKPTSSTPPRDFVYPPTSHRNKAKQNLVRDERLTTVHIATSSIRNTLSSEGSRCSVPARSEKGDMVVLFRGCTLPAVLRSIGADSKQCELIGYLYCLDYIVEEVFRMWDATREQQTRKRKGQHSPSDTDFGPIREDLPTQEFVIV